MAGNTRGKLKEHFEGIHRNFDWIEYHCDLSVALIGGRNYKLEQAIKALHKEIRALDKLSQGLYATI